MGEFINIIQEWVKEKPGWSIRPLPSQPDMATLRHASASGWVAMIWERNLLIRWGLVNNFWFELHGYEPDLFAKIEKFMAVSEWSFSVTPHRDVSNHEAMKGVERIFSTVNQYHT